MIRHWAPPSTRSAATWLDGQVARAGADLAPQQPGSVRKVAGDADVHHDDVDPGLAGEHIHGCPPGTEVGDHLGRDLLGPGRHALGEDAVVPGEDGDRRPLGDGWRALARDPRQLHPDVLEAPERAPRLGQPIVQLACFTHRSFVHHRSASAFNSDRVR